MIDFTASESYLFTGADASLRRRAAITAVQEAADAGQAVFATDPTGRLSGIAGSMNPSVTPDGVTAPLLGEPGEEAGSLASPIRGGACEAGGGVPVTFWDVYAARGLALRTTASELGPYLTAMLLELNEAQSELLTVLYQIADDAGLLLIDTKDLRALIGEVTENQAAYEKNYGSIHAGSASAILKAITLLEQKGGKDFVYEPAIDVKDFVNPSAPDGAPPLIGEAGEEAEVSSLTGEPGEGAGSLACPDRGGACEAGGGVSPRIHILDAQDLCADEVLYRVMVLYLLSECAENPDVSRMVIIIDDAGIVLGQQDKTFLNQVRSLLSRLSEQEITIVFLAEQETDVPAQIRDRLSCAPIDEGAVADDVKGITLAARKAIMEADPLAEKYKVPFERDSAYEFLLRRGLTDETTESLPPADTPGADAAQSTDGAAADDAKTAAESAAENAKEELEALGKRAKSSAQSLGNTVAGTVGRQIGKSIGENFGSFGSTLGGNIGASLGRGIMKTFFGE